jgi:valyl-tRNA synthetase
MSESGESNEKKSEALAEQVNQIIANPDSAAVKIAAPADGGGVDLASELRGDLEQVKVPQQVDPQVKDALEKLREGTKEGLSPSDHYDLGVAYMGMGLVDDAVREFNNAKKRPAKAKANGKKSAPAAKTAPKPTVAKAAVAKPSSAKASVAKPKPKQQPTKAKPVTKAKSALKKAAPPAKKAGAKLKKVVAKAKASKPARKAKGAVKKLATKARATVKASMSRVKTKAKQAQVKRKPARR